MKKNQKAVIVCMVIAVLLVTCAIATNGQVEALLYYLDIKITLNGEELIPTDANGKYVEPFVIDGTTYLPVRAISNALGLDVQWDGETSTVILSEPVAPEMTAEQKNALESAKSYLRVTAFSKEGLVEQLEFEGYTRDNAEFAAANCGADWNEQALKSAQSYLRVSAFSYSGLIEQLEFGDFTPDQAKYGVDNCGADWNEQAAKMAASYLDIMPFSRAGLIDQLEYAGFTYDQAVYGVEANGL